MVGRFSNEGLSSVSPRGSFCFSTPGSAHRGNEFLTTTAENVAKTLATTTRKRGFGEFPDGPLPEAERSLVRNACTAVLSLVTYSCAAQAAAGELAASLPRGNLLRIAAGQRRLESTVTICLVTNPNRPMVDAAETLADRIFAFIGVKVQWHEPPVCPPGTEPPIFLVIQTSTPKAYFPGALGVALPLDGSHVWVFYDRVRQAVPDFRVPALLAHVMAHETAHVLKGINRHSVSGILKAHWSEREIARMALLPLAFTPADAILIHHGIEERRSRVASGRPEPQVERFR
jgi:hypothetical protein